MWTSPLMSMAIIIGKYIPVNNISSKTGRPLKDKEILEDEKGKELRTYAEAQMGINRSPLPQ